MMRCNPPRAMIGGCVRCPAIPALEDISSADAETVARAAIFVNMAMPRLLRQTILEFPPLAAPPTNYLCPSCHELCPTRAQLCPMRANYALTREKRSATLRTKHVDEQHAKGIGRAPSAGNKKVLDEQT